MVLLENARSKFIKRIHHEKRPEGCIVSAIRYLLLSSPRASRMR